MSNSEKRRRQKENTARAREERERTEKKARQRKTAIRVAVIAAVAVAGFFLLNLFTGDDNKDVSTTASTSATTEAPTTTAAAAAASAAGKDCVAVTDPLPAGAPNVPVKVGPPPTELVKEDLEVGTGAEVKPGATITANYIGVACSTGEIFDSSWSGGQPIEFSLDGVIDGWTEGIPGMRVGGSRLLGLPAAMAYGAAGSPPKIAPDEVLWFVVDVEKTQ